MMISFATILGINYPNIGTYVSQQGCQTTIKTQEIVTLTVTAVTVELRAYEQRH